MNLSAKIKSSAKRFTCFIRFSLLIAFCGLTITSARAQQTHGSTDYAAKVNTMIGTEGKGKSPQEMYLEAGFTFPGATYPFGMVQFTTTFFDQDKGFVVNQLSGAGCPHMGNFPTLPLNNDLLKSPNDMKGYHPQYRMEKAMAGYYKVKLGSSNINCELSATKRTGMAQYQFSDTANHATIIIGSGINATKINNASIKITGPGKCEGYADGGSFCGIKTDYKVYFVAEFDATPIVSGTWKDNSVHPSSTSESGENSGAYFTFDVSAKKQIHYKFAISYVSIANAKQNLAVENPGWNFAAVKKAAVLAWNKQLGKIEADGGDNDLTTQFYTHLYHAFVHPSIANDVNGQYMGADNNIKKAVGFTDYTEFSNWDTYRTTIPLLAMLAPKETSDMMESLVKFAQQSGGGFPRWVMANVETGIMQGDPTSIVVANAYAFGATNFDTKQALAIMRRGAEVPGTKSQAELTRPQLDQYLTKGYAQASMSLEYNSADFAIGRFALNTTGDRSLYHKYLQSAQKWKNIYNPKTGWLQSRNADGSWKYYTDDMREASYKNYFWMVPFNLGKLIDTIGGKNAAEKRLDDFFVRLDADYGQEWFAAGNEPDFQVPWIYNWAGAPYKTQALIRRIMKESYSDKNNGLPGNDDLGAMGAWYVFAGIGLYPMIPGEGGFTVNSPSFSLIKIHMGSGKVLTITGGSQTKAYVTGLKIDGKGWNNAWIPYSLIKNGGTIQYSLSNRPNKKWGVAKPPPSFN
jgi:predicted alpha-1,2-mannosidase